MTREEARDIFEHNWTRLINHYYADSELNKALGMAIKALEREAKTGHWIVEVWNNREHHTCSSCQHVVDYEPCYHYCPYCGAEMSGE